MYDLIVLTPPPYGPASLAHRWLWATRDQLRGRFVRDLGGHYAVTRSLLAGLAQLDGLSWRYLTRYRGERARTIVALAHPQTVHWGIDAKRRGLCDRLLAGPNISDLPSSGDAVQLSPEVDAVLVPHDLVARAYECDSPALVGRVTPWAAGVDTAAWAPPATLDRREVLMDDKGRRDELLAIRAAAEAAGHRTSLLSYGSHHPDAYRQGLARATACVVLNRGESQGIALLEAWSMNVPTFVQTLPPGDAAISPAPYLTPQTGAFWTTPDEALSLLRPPSACSPRQWVLDNLTDKLSAERLLAIALPAGGDE